MRRRQERPTLGNVQLTSQVRDALRVEARAAKDVERGGLAIGYRVGPDVIVTDIIAVADTTATRSSYIRGDVAARATLNAYLMHLEPDSIQGYVGEWHTHASPSPPSETDRRAMRAMARSNELPVVLLVAALSLNRVDVNFYALISGQGRVGDRARGAFLDAMLTTWRPAPN